jgi:transcriptional antiterminator NusG
MAKQTQHHGRSWYVLHTYSGYEDNVSRNLKQRIESMDMGEYIFDVMVPKEKKIKIKGGKRVVIEERIYPGYVLVDMMVTDASWYVVRNTPNVTGFIGLGTTPTPVDPKEIESLKKRMGVSEPKYKIDIKIGDAIKISEGPFKDFDGKVQEIDEEKGKLKVLVSIFGRETPVELDFLQVKKI